MTKISTFVPDTEINGKDKLIGTDYNNAQKTKNFKVEDLGTHFNLVNGSRNFEYLFYNHLSISQAPVDGAFYANGNEQDPNNITHFFISKKTSNNKDVSSFFDSITAENPFDLIISQSTDLNTIFFFNISDVESINGYYKLTVSEVFFPQGKTLEFMASNMVFNLKANSESIHNNLSGLNDGDYKHLTAIEKTKFDNLPNSFVTDHSQLNLDDGTNPHGTTKTDVGLSNVNNTSDADKPVSTAQQTALNLKQDNLTETNFGTFSNGLTTNDSIVDSDLINYTDVSDSNKQKKTTWFNIKAKLTTVFNDLFVSKVTTTDVEKVYIKNADGTQGMKPTSEFGGGEDFLYETIRWVSFDSTTLNTWKSTTPSYYKYDTATINDFGTGVTPTEGTSGYYLTAFHIPDGYEVESIKLIVNIRTPGGGNLQVYINRGETNSGNTGNVIANAFNIVNEVVSIPNGSDRPLFLQPLTVAPQSPITLAHGFMKISVRETTNSSINYGLNFNIVYKKI